MSYRRRLLIVSIILFISGGFGFQATAQDTVSLRVLKIKKLGDYKVAVGTVVMENGKNVFKPHTTATITIGKDDTPATLAKQVMTKIGNGAMLDPNDNTNVLVPATKTITAFVPDEKAVDFVKEEADIRVVTGSLPVPNTTPVAELSFGPNPDNAQDRLVSATDITIPAVSFTAPMGTSITSLTSLVNSELDTGGYLTSMLDSTDIIIFAQGSSNIAPLEVDYIFDPLAEVGDRDILTGLSLVPEPGSIALLSTGLVFLGMILRRRSAPNASGGNAKQLPLFPRRRQIRYGR
jgi:hypothetical protein